MDGGGVLVHLQRSKKLHKHIQSDGCALMCAAYFVNQYTTRDMSPEHINQVYINALKSGTMKERSYMVDWGAVLYALGMNAYYMGHKSAEWKPAEDEFEILLYKYAPNNWWHFVCGDGNGNPTYDPWGSAGKGFRGAKTVALGSLHSKRAFKLNGSI